MSIPPSLEPFYKACSEKDIDYLKTYINEVGINNIEYPKIYINEVDIKNTEYYILFNSGWEEGKNFLSKVI